MKRLPFVIIALCALIAGAVYAQTGIFGVSTTTEVLVLTTATKLPNTVSAKGRVGLEIQNLGPNQIFCAFSAATAVVDKARMVAVDGAWKVDAPEHTSIWCVAATANQITGNATIVSEIMK